MSVLRRILRVVFVAADVVLLALFLVGYTAAFLPPGRLWWTELVAVGLPYVSLLLLVATPVLFLRRRPRLAAAHVLLVVLAAIRFLPWAPLTHGVEEREGALRIMTLNLSPWWDYYPLPERIDRMRALIGQADPHLVFFQEATIQYFEEEPVWRAAPYVRVLWEEAGYRTLPPADFRPAYTPQPTLSRAPLHSHRQEILRMEPHDRAYTHVVRSTFTWEGREAVAYNLHLRSFGADKPWRAEERALFSPAFWIPYIRQYRTAYEVRAREVEIIRSMIERETHPVIVVGDLNSTSHNWAFRRLAEGFQDAFQTAGRGWGATYHSRLPIVRIDFILASEEWEIVAADAVDSQLSDHRPVVATLQWRK